MKLPEATGPHPEMVHGPGAPAKSGPPVKGKKAQFAAMLGRKKDGGAILPETEGLLPGELPLPGAGIEKAPGGRAKTAFNRRPGTAEKEPGPRPKSAGRKADAPVSTMAAAVAPAPFQAPAPQSVARDIEKTQSPTEVRQLDDLVQEISVAVRDDRTTQVDIQLNSRTFNGLRVQITGDQTGAVGIQFITPSPQVSEFLAGNFDRLSDGLERRGVRVSEIRIAKRDGVGRGFSAPQKGGSGARQGGK